MGSVDKAHLYSDNMDQFNNYLSQYYPLLTLGGVPQRANQYRDAERGVPYSDRIPSRELWGRALNDQIDAFHQSIPEYLQLQRQQALDKEKIAYDREQRKYQQQLNPMLLKQQQLSNQLNEQKLGVYEGYYERIESLPIDEKQKQMFRDMNPQQGVPIMNSMLQTLATRKPADKFVTLPAGHPNNPYKDRPIVDNQTTGNWTDKGQIGGTTRQASVEDEQVKWMAKQMNMPADEVAKMITVTESPGQQPKFELSKLFTPKLQEQQLEKHQPTVSQKFTDRFSDPNTIQNFADLSTIGIDKKDDQKEFIFNQVWSGKIRKDHHLAKQALDHVNKKHIKIGPKGVFISEGYKKDYTGARPMTAGAPQQYYVQPGDDVNKIVEKMWKERGIKVNPKQLVASNPQFFSNKPYEISTREMPHSEQLDGALMTIPVGGGDVTETQRVGARDEFKKTGMIKFKGYGLIIPHKDSSIKQEIELNDDYNEMVDLHKTVDQYAELMDNINARGMLPTGSKERGYVQGLRWRIVNKIQVLRDYGVLTPGEIDVIEKSAPNFNSFWNLLGRANKGDSKLHETGETWDTDRFVKGVLQALRDEGVNKAKRLRATMEAYNIPIIEYERDIETGPTRIYGPRTGAFTGSGGGTSSGVTNTEKLEDL